MRISPVENTVLLDTFEQVIDQWQEDLPEFFPKKPARKVFLTPEDENTAMKKALEEYRVSPTVANMAMSMWKKGRRWEKAVVRNERNKLIEERRNRPLSASQLFYRQVRAAGRRLQKDFPDLFDRKKVILLKVDIHKDLTEWRETHDIPAKVLGLAIRNWVSRPKYKEYRDECIAKGEGIRYGLKMEQYPVRKS